MSQCNIKVWVNSSKHSSAFSSYKKAIFASYIPFIMSIHISLTMGKKGYKLIVCRATNNSNIMKVSVHVIDEYVERQLKKTRNAFLNYFTNSNVKKI